MNWIELLKAEDEREAWGARCMDCGAPARTYDRGRKQSPYCDECWDRWAARFAAPECSAVQPLGPTGRSFVVAAVMIVMATALILMALAVVAVRCAFGF
jgi:hypothetical protein